MCVCVCWIVREGGLFQDAGVQRRIAGIGLLGV